MPTDVLEGLRVCAYGDSYLASDVENTPGARYIDRLKSRFGFSLVTNRAVNGYYMSDALEKAWGNTSSKWVPGTHEVVLVDCTTNDIGGHGDASLGLAGFERALTSFIHVLSLGARTEETSFAFSPVGWTPESGGTLASGGNDRYTQLAAAYVDVTVTSGTHLLSVLAWPAATADGDVVTVKQGATLIHTIDTNEMMNSILDIMPILVPVTGPGTFRIQKANLDTSYLAVDARVTVNPNPPTIVLVKGCYLGAAGYTAGGAGASDATVDAHNALIDTVAAGFSHIVTVDPLPGFDDATMLGSDAVHPNDRGMAHYADAIEAVLVGLDYRQGQNALI